MNILQICSAREIGGGERHFVDLVNGLAKRGHHVYAALATNSPLVNEITSLSGESILMLPLRNSVDVMSAARMARFARERSIDIIHAHVARDYPIAALASRWSGDTPYVLTRHVLFPMKRVHRLLLNRVSGVIAVSSAVADELRDQTIFDARKIVTILNGIDVARFAHRDDVSAVARPNDRLLVGMVGHIAPIKGQDEFVQAAATVASRRDDVDFLIVGEDKSRDGRNRTELDRSIKRHGMTERIRLTGWLDDVRDALETLDVFVSPSHTEPFGLAIAEAMACGVPVVATRSEGALEIIEDGVTGRLVPIGDTIALAGAIGGLLADPVECERLSRKALDTIRVRFSLERMVEDTEGVYFAAVASLN